MKYIKKPIPIEAVEITDDQFTVETLEGTMRGNKGDFLITGVRGEKYICQRDIFLETYEAVQE